jgi:hypothetical protein
MISAVTILCVSAIVLTLVLVLKLIFSFHEEDGVVEIDIRDKGKGKPLWHNLVLKVLTEKHQRYQPRRKAKGASGHPFFRLRSNLADYCNSLP